MELLLGLFVGIGLAAATGFRVFVPLFIMSVAANTGNLALTGAFEWLATPGAVVVFGAASVAEIAAYYIPWLDNLLDTIATPAAVVAGTVVTASFISDLSPWLQWPLAIIAGGGAAGMVQTLTTLTRATSTATTGGLANPVVSTGEAIGAAGMSLLAIALPVITVVVVAILLIVLIRKMSKRKKKRQDNKQLEMW